MITINNNNNNLISAHRTQKQAGWVINTPAWNSRMSFIIPLKPAIFNNLFNSQIFNFLSVSFKKQ